MQPQRKTAAGLNSWSLGLATLAALGLSAVLPQAAQAQLVIHPTFDSSITSDPNGTTIEQTINNAISVYESTFTNPITVSIDFSEMSGGLGQSSTYYDQISYTEYRNALIATKMGTGDTAFLTNVPAGPDNPINGGTLVDVTTANMRALGLNSGVVPFDSTISINTSITNDSRTGSQNPAFYDLQAVVSHEMDEALGIGSAITNPDGTAIRGFDLYRYSASGVRSFTDSSSASVYFSVDGGQTAVLDQYGKPVYFNQTGGGADYNDWASSSNARVQDAFGKPGTAPNLGPAELTALQVLGYNLAAAPEPSAWASLGLGVLGLGALTLRARKRRAA